MPGIDDALERLVTDASFRQQLNRDPTAALAGYELSDDDLRLLATQVSSEPGGDHHVEARTSRSALFSLFTQVGDAGDGTGGRAEQIDVPGKVHPPETDGDGTGDSSDDQRSSHA